MLHLLLYTKPTVTLPVLSSIVLKVGHAILDYQDKYHDIEQNNVAASIVTNVSLVVS